ncbi:hypothetical protein [Niallia sp.]|uniref:hypothetical protein n=1 Tax=Niallia sp. TaxID=2837523 RepID=UPI0028985B8F|nr:hypothetical protein [Niallia sp.]
MISFKNDKGKNIAEFNIHYPADDFFTLVDHIKQHTNLKLDRTETTQIDEDENQISLHIIYYSDLYEQIGIRIKESSVSIDFGSFITLSAVLDREKSKELENSYTKEIRINIITKQENTLYSVSIDNIKKYYLMESTAHLSNYEIKKILDGKRPFKIKEIRLK